MTTIQSLLLHQLANRQKICDLEDTQGCRMEDIDSNIYLAYQVLEYQLQF